jgi:three-Cys-motif partner protein
MMIEPITWDREDHTAAKHDLLLGFFKKWVSVHSETFAKRGGGLVRIYDGFAGPGVYSGGEAGSPMILTRALWTNPRLQEQWSSVRYELHFVEKHPERAAMLETKLKEFERAMQDAGNGCARVSWSVTCGRYEENLPKLVTTRNSALFLFLDPFGYSHAPMTLTRGLVQQPKSDTLIFLPLSFVNRFVGRDRQARAMDRFFGTTAWRNVPDGPGRPRALLDLFQDQLRAAGLDWVLPFRIQPEAQGNEYWIVGGSGHPVGFESIKQGFWAVDKINGQGFASPKSPPLGQATLDFEYTEEDRPNTAPLLALLQERFGRIPFTVEEAQEATARSRFLTSHLKRMTLADAEKRRLLLVERPPRALQFKEGRGIVMRFA